ncbi:MAG TPA: DUF5996 family protein [Thermoanaerobaculia bacterium]|nr:DUF5996 family protein [Thermoanaerobaculia bacterium]
MTAHASSNASEAWPDLPLERWKDTLDTLHLWTQIVGKIRLTLSPPLNHCWSDTLYVTARGLTTSPIPSGNRVFEIELDFVSHRLEIRTVDGAVEAFALAPQSVAAFYGRLFAALEKLGLRVAIHKTPNEVADPIPFDLDEVHASYDAKYANRFWRALVQSDRVFKIFRARFIGKCSPVHFFWGAPDLAVTRFSGRVAPVHPGGIPNLPDEITRDAYSHECSSCGFWAGSGAVAEPAFYAYAYPAPPGFAEASVRPDAAYFSKDFGEFILPYAAVRTAASPDETLLAFLQSTYDAAADLGRWDREALERPGS